MRRKQATAITGDPAFAVDDGGTIVDWNAAAEEMLGYRRSEVVGRSCWEVLRGRDGWGNSYCGPACPLREMARRGEPVRRTRLCLRTAGGGCLDLAVSTLTTAGGSASEGEIVHLLSTPSDRLGRGRAPEPVNLCSNNNTHLTERELEVIQLLGGGLGTGEIADTLCISSATTRHHIQSIFRKLKVHNRLQAVVKAGRLGLIPNGSERRP